MASVVQMTIGNIKELKEVIAQLLPKDYITSIPEFNGSTVGAHLRHVIEFYQCLLYTKNDVVNYDLRNRDIAIESSIELALSKLDEIIEQLCLITDRPLNLNVSYGVDTDMIEVTVPTSVFRELIYNIEHTIHHAALIRVALSKYFAYVNLPAHFGYASSTIRNQIESNVYSNVTSA